MRQELQGTSSGRLVHGTGRLYVIATPIGNLEDLSSRAARLLGEVDLVLAEDTRQVRKLLNHLGVRTPTQALHEHNEAASVARVLQELEQGCSLALVSDAGTPLLSDPGFHLVRACRERGHAVLAVPGPSAVLAALSVSGLPPYPFTFAGFMPARAGARLAFLERLASLPHTLVLFVSPHRLGPELAACAECLGAAREAVLLSEITKIHERQSRATLGELAARAGEIVARGEHTLVVGPPATAARSAPGKAEARRALEAALEAGKPLAEARRAAARALGITRRELYDLLTPSRTPRAAAEPGKAR